MNHKSKSKILQTINIVHFSQHKFTFCTQLLEECRSQWLLHGLYKVCKKLLLLGIHATSLISVSANHLIRKHATFS